MLPGEEKYQTALPLGKDLTSFSSSYVHITVPFIDDVYFTMYGAVVMLKLTVFHISEVDFTLASV